MTTVSAAFDQRLMEFRGKAGSDRVAMTDADALARDTTRSGGETRGGDEDPKGSSRSRRRGSSIPADGLAAQKEGSSHRARPVPLESRKPPSRAVLG
jgi:hypothetical protein